MPEAFLAVDRADFVPDRVWCGGDEGSDDVAVDRGGDPDVWAKAVYDSTMPIVAQFDDGAVAWPEQGARPPSVGVGADSGGRDAACTGRRARRTGVEGRHGHRLKRGPAGRDRRP